MVKAAALALSSAALVVTASSFVVPSFSRPSGISLPSASAFTAVTAKPRCHVAGSIRMRDRRRGQWPVMSSKASDTRDGKVGGGERYYGPTSKPLLDSVHSPADMKRFSISELKQLAYELRWETLEVRFSFPVIPACDARASSIFFPCNLMRTSCV